MALIRLPMHCMQAQKCFRFLKQCYYSIIVMKCPFCNTIAYSMHDPTRLRRRADDLCDFRVIPLHWICINSCWACVRHAKRVSHLCEFANVFTCRQMWLLMASSNGICYALELHRTEPISSTTSTKSLAQQPSGQFHHQTIFTWLT